MSRQGILAIVVLALSAFTVAEVADAARMGGGRSFGSQRSFAPPAAAPNAASRPVMPAQPGATLAKPATPAAAAAAAPAARGASRWLGPLAGIAAGLGIAALLSHFGLPEGLGSFLLLGLLIVAGVMVLKLLFARKTAPMQYAGGVPGGALPQDVPAAPAAAAWGGASRQPSAASRIPPGFDAAAFARVSKAQFIQLQSAYDNADIAALGEVMTPQMLDQVKRDLEARGESRPTEIVTLDATVLEAVTEGDQHWMSVRFTGLLREDGALQPKPIDEIWNLVKPVSGKTGWLLAGIQQGELTETA